MSQLRRSPPVPLSRFLSVLEALQDVAALDGRRVPAAEALLVPSLREAGTALPTHALVHFRWVLERCLTPHSYVPASAQEALLQVFLNERVASDLSVLADRLRSGAQPTPPVTVAPVPASSQCLPVGLPGPPSLPSAAPLPGHPADPLGLPEDPVALLGLAPEPLPAARPGLPAAPVGAPTPVPLAQPPPAGEPGLPRPPSSPSAAPLAGDPADPMPDADSAAPCLRTSRVWWLSASHAAILPLLRHSSSSRGPSKISSSKVSARSLTYSPLGCCSCSAPLPGAPMFCVRCRLWPRWLLPSPTMRLSPHVLWIC